MADSAPTTPAAVAPPKKKAPLVALALVVVAGSAFGAIRLLNKGKESTDDAFVEAHVAPVAARVAGQVARVLVRDGQQVKAGDVLVELDTADLAARLELAEADLAQARAQKSSADAQLAVTTKTARASLAQARGGLNQASSSVDASRATLNQAKADLSAAETRLSLAAIELSRSQGLFERHAVSQADLDARQSTFDQAKAAKEQAEARMASTAASITGSEGGLELARGRVAQAETVPEQLDAARAAVGVAEARLMQAEASRKLAALALSYATVRAPVDGVVARKNVEPGMMVGPERTLCVVVALDDVWVTANFKEDQIAHMKEGQKATIVVDTFDGVELTARIDAISGGTGSRFSLLPPDNASGNFVKVVQRVPVILRFDAPPSVVLRPGMSSEVTVVTE